MVVAAASPAPEFYKWDLDLSADTSKVNPISETVSSELDLNSNDRRLYETYTDIQTMSNSCKLNCIDKQKNFCPVSNF